MPVSAGNFPAKNRCHENRLPNAPPRSGSVQPPHATDPATAFCFQITPLARGRWCGPLAMHRSPQQSALLVAVCLLTCLSAKAASTFSMSNFVFYSELERTNPAILKARAKEWQIKEQRMLVNGFQTIPYLREFQDVFTNCIEFRDYSPNPDDQQLWNWQIGLHGRYLLRMQIPFKVDATWTNVLSFEEPKFYVMEWHDIGRFGFYEIRKFGVPEWKRLAASAGDLSAVGITPVMNSPFRGFESQWKNYHVER
jgi:hypothetical protein